MTDQKTPKIEPVHPSTWKEPELDALGAFPGGRDFVLANWDGDDPRGTNALAIMLNHLPLAKAFLTFNNHVATASTLSKRIREILILRISWLTRSEYELVQHLVLGKRAGLSDEEIENIMQGPDAEGWDPVDADLLRAVDELCTESRIQDDTWQRLSEHFDHRQLMDLIFVIGCYQLLAQAFNSLDIPLESGVEPMDPTLRERMYAQNGSK